MKRYLKKVIYYNGKTINERSFCDSIPENDDSEGVLYLADTGEMLQLLKRQGVPVAGWIRKGCEQENLSAAFYAVEDPEELDEAFFERIYRREKGIPWEILETKRCLVREMTQEDGEAFAVMYEDPALEVWMQDFHGNADAESAYIREYEQQYRFYEYGIWSIVEKTTGEIIGRAGLTNEGDGGLPALGYMIGTPWQRKGFAYEVCREILNYGKEELGFEEISLWVHKENIPSLELAGKLGFRQVREEGERVYLIYKACETPGIVETDRNEKNCR